MGPHAQGRSLRGGRSHAGATRVHSGPQGRRRRGGVGGGHVRGLLERGRWGQSTWPARGGSQCELRRRSAPWPFPGPGLSGSLTDGCSPCPCGLGPRTRPGRVLVREQRPLQSAWAPPGDGEGLACRQPGHRAGSPGLRGRHAGPGHGLPEGPWHKPARRERICVAPGGAGYGRPSHGLCIGVTFSAPFPSTLTPRCASLRPAVEGERDEGPSPRPAAQPGAVPRPARLPLGSPLLPLRSPAGWGPAPWPPGPRGRGSRLSGRQAALRPCHRPPSSSHEPQGPAPKPLPRTQGASVSWAARASAGLLPGRLSPLRVPLCTLNSPGRVQPPGQVQPPTPKGKSRREMPGWDLGAPPGGRAPHRAQTLCGEPGARGARPALTRPGPQLARRPGATEMPGGCSAPGHQRAQCGHAAWPGWQTIRLRPRDGRWPRAPPSPTSPARPRPAEQTGAACRAPREQPRGAGGPLGWTRCGVAEASTRPRPGSGRGAG